MATKNDGKAVKAVRAGQLVAGFKKHFPDPKQQITFGAVTRTVGDVESELQAFVDNRADVVAAQGVARTKVQAERAALPATDAFLGALVAFVRLTFGAQAGVLTDFGITPRKVRTPRTAEQKAVAAAKAKATREARGTRGPKAKQAVHGNVTAELVVKPGAQAPAAASTATPAPATTPTQAPAATQTPQKS
jgi:hypothetical protein